MNSSGLTPVGLSILVMPDAIAETTASGIVVGTPMQIEKEQHRQTDGVVIAIGEFAYYDEKKPRCKVGDRVIMIPYAGMVRRGVDNNYYRLIKDDDVVALLDKGNTNE